MATIISSKTAGIGGLSITGDASGVLALASGNGVTGLSISASQDVTFTNPLTSTSLITPTITSGTLITPTIDSAPVPTVVGTAPIYMCRAWVNFNGTGTVAIRASGNVSSITDNGTGDYTVNFTTAMLDANYNAVCLGSTVNSGAGEMPCVWTVDSTQTTSAFKVRSGRPPIPAVILPLLADLININISIFR
jgi:hypothetical protein